MNINQILKDRRQELRVGQSKLAHYCGFAHRSSISRLENEEIEWKFRDVVRAAELLKIEINISNKGERMFSIDRDKLNKVVEIFNKEIDPRATNEEIENEICADWHNEAEHQDWLNEAEPSEIADWLASFYSN